MRNGRPRSDEADERYANGDHAALDTHGALRSTIDYDLGYDANGWDTQGFRSPEAGYFDSKAATGDLDDRATGDRAGGGVQTAPGRGNGHAGSHARTNDVPASGAAEFRGRGRRARDRSEAKVTPAKVTPAKVTPAKVKGSWWRHWTVRKALGVLLGGVGAFIVLGAVAVAVAYEKTPVPTEAMAATSYVQSVVYSSDGTLIGRFGTTNRQMLTYNQIPQGIINAVLAAEDRQFLTEGGISPASIMRAAYEDITGHDGSLQGGSTITQQFVRNFYQGIGTQQTLSRKIKEIFVAMKVAKEKSKQWILTNYLNTIYLGEGAYGIQAAAETYFDKPVSQLSVAQDAVIAAMIQQPSTYPLPQYRPELKARWRYVIDGMVQMGTLTAPKAATITFPRLGDYVPQSVGNDVWDPYILNMVYNELIQVYHFSQSQIYNGGYVIRTTIDDSKMAALYQAVSQNEAQINASADPFEPYMHVGAVLEDPGTGAIQALYPGPGYPESRYNGTGRVITLRECKKIACEVNMAVYNREQVGSSFKPYILSAAVKQDMNVQTSTLDGYDPLWIPPDSQPNTYGTSAQPADSYQWYEVSNDDAGENGPFTPQMAMAESINTAYTDLWHKVAGPNGANVAEMAQEFGVNIAAAGITGPSGIPGSGGMEDEAGIALGQASLTVGEQASMLATIDDYGVYHDPHVIKSISRNNVLTPIKITSYQVFSASPTLNADEATQVQYAMSEDTAPYGTAPTAALDNGQEVIAKTGTTNTAQSAFFIGAIPTQTLAVALFTSNQTGSGDQTLNNLGGLEQGGFGGTWPATIWHTYAEDMFPQAVEQFQPVVFTGQTWNLVPPNLRVVPKPHKRHHGPVPGGQPTPPPGFPSPVPTFSCNPQLAFCDPSPPVTPPPFGGRTRAVNVTAAGAAVGGIFAALPATCLWVRRRTRKRGPKRG
jgi:membrane peptidoglycan carboxypeptidase